MNESTALGIIGGADGPTAVFVTGDPISLIIMAAIAIAVIGFIVYRLLKK